MKFELFQRKFEKPGFTLLGLILILALIALIAAIILPARAVSFNVPTQSGNLIAVTNQPATVATLATSNIVSWVKLVPGKGMSLQWIFNQSGASTSNATLNVYSVVDATNISTVPFAALTAPSTGTTDVRVNTNWDANKLAGYDSLVVGNIANSTALTTLTNKSIVIRRDP